MTAPPPVPPGGGYGSQPPPPGGPPYGGPPAGGPPYGGMPPQGPPPPMGPSPYSGPPQQGNDTPKILGIISIITGALGTLVACCCWPVGALFAIGTFACAGIGLSQIQGQPQSDAKPLLIIGMVLGGVVVLVTILGVVLGAANIMTDYTY